MLKTGLTKASINNYIASLKAAISKAIEWEIIQFNPMTKVKLYKLDDNAVVRYLSIDEEKRLRKALTEREKEIKQARTSANEWREARQYATYTEYSGEDFADHLMPMIIISINTGMRRGELFNLHWEEVNFQLNHLTILGGKSKNGKTRHIPMNKEVQSVLNQWQKQGNKTSGLVFPGKYGNAFDNVNKSWQSILRRANIDNFRWHDMRHHFASKLVMAGVDLNTVRELLGHSDIKMTLRYAHLAPEHKAAAVAKLVTD